ncbi:phage tail sheath family protein [Heyndrickxia sporothermodurans]
MTGGTWTNQNKVRPGVYINFESEAQPVGAIGDRGIVTMALSLSWGKSKSVITVDSGEDIFDQLGYSIVSEQALLIREALKRAKTLHLYRLNEGTQATAIGGGLTVTALYGGLRGNDIFVSVQKVIDDPSKFEVKTFVNSNEVDAQTISDASELKSNEWVSFKAEEELSETAGFPLSGGTDGTVTNQDHIDYLSEIEKYQFNTMALVSEDATLKDLYSTFIKRMREVEGNMAQVVLSNYPSADNEGVISVKNGVVLEDGTLLSSAQATAWTAGAEASAEINESLTYTTYDGAVDANPRYTNSEIMKALQNGEFVFTYSNGAVIVEQDINTFTSITPKKAKHWSKNRVIRVLDSINNDFHEIFSRYYIGKISNNEDGRNLFKNECINYLNKLQSIEAIQNFDSQTDIIVSKGNDIDAVYTELYVQPVDSLEKFYFKVYVR